MQFLQHIGALIVATKQRQKIKKSVCGIAIVRTAKQLLIISINENI